MKKQQDQVKVFTRRAFVIGGLQGAILGVLGGRLAWLQVAQGSRYKTLSEKNRINLKVLAPNAVKSLTDTAYRSLSMRRISVL